MYGLNKVQFPKGDILHDDISSNTVREKGSAFLLTYSVV